MSANMDTTGTFEMAEAFSAHKMITCLHKHYTVEEIVKWADRVGPEVCENVAITAGMSEPNFQKVKAVF
jgi:GMP reductase